MINPNWREGLAKATVFIGDVKVGETQSISVDTETIKPMGVPIKGYGGTISVENAFVDAKRFMELYMTNNADFDITVRKLKATTRKPRSKKKRIQKKWTKKNTVELTTYKNCSIEGVTTGRMQNESND